MTAEGISIQWKRVPAEVRKTSGGNLEVVSKSSDGTDEQTAEFDSVLLAIGQFFLVLSLIPILIENIHYFLSH